MPYQEARIQRKLARIRDHRDKQTASKAASTVKIGRYTSYVQIKKDRKYD